MDYLLDRIDEKVFLNLNFLKIFDELKVDEDSIIFLISFSFSNFSIKGTTLINSPTLEQ